MLEYDKEPENIDIESEEPGGAVEALCSEYRSAYDKVEKLSELLKEANAIKTNCSQLLYDAMVAESLEGVKTLDGSFSPVLQEKCGLKKEHEEKVFDLFEELGLGASIKRTLNFQTLNKHYRDGDFTINENNEELFSLWSVKSIRMRRSK